MTTNRKIKYRRRKFIICTPYMTGDTLLWAGIFEHAKHIVIHVFYRVNISSGFSRNLEANASQLLQNFED